jgi:DNA processing protein
VPPETLLDHHGEAEKFATLRLLRTPQIGSVTFWELIAHFGTAEAALAALPQFARRTGGFSAGRIPSAAAVTAELERADRTGLKLAAAGEPGYPPYLAKVEVPPPLLYIKGNETIWSRPPIAIVGSRRASAAGLKFAAELSASLSGIGFVVVSGLARGIDAAAHRAALPEATCAVLPGGLDTIYPPEHGRLAEEIAGNGLLLSECPPGFQARAQDFPRRNRIISGSCLGVVVVEAAERSGTLITARLAAEQSRDVFAVPGHPYEPRAAGTNRLIREGAILTTGADDILEALHPVLSGWRSPLSKATSAHAASKAPDAPAVSLDEIGVAADDLLKLLSFAPIDIDDLCRLSGMEARHVNAALLSLDLSGHIERRGFRQVALRA